MNTCIIYVAAAAAGEDEMAAAGVETALCWGGGRKGRKQEGGRFRKGGSGSF